MSDVTPIRRRGRPPGSKNRPKTPSLVRVRANTGGVLPDGTTNHPPIDFTAEPIESFTELQMVRLPVHIQYKPAMGGSAIEQEADVEWPANWPLPLIGQNVNVGDFGGTLVGVTFDLAKQRLAFRLQ